MSARDSFARGLRKGDKRGRRGGALFATLGCIACHGRPDGDAGKQFDAIWQWLLHGRKLPPVDETDR